MAAPHRTLLSKKQQASPSVARPAHPYARSRPVRRQTLHNCRDLAVVRRTRMVVRLPEGRRENMLKDKIVDFGREHRRRAGLQEALRSIATWFAAEERPGLCSEMRSDVGGQGRESLGELSYGTRCGQRRGQQST